MTVKEKRRGRPVGGAALSRERILEVATELLGQGGKVPSLRKLAAELGVDVMALYHYFPNKTALLEALCCQLVAGIYAPVEGQPWRQELARLSQSYLSLLRRHGGLLETLLGMSSTGPAQVFMARFDQAVAPLSLDKAQRGHAMALLVDYLHGFALAIHCNSCGGLEDETHLAGPLNFYLDALQARA
ncbi:TetR/AcrR family transcriptional regulator [Ferrimonas sediminicola]|uniref:TetR/AcrR family transcriptional regulator n=1 Tax=Ferrimonas sediminicola TaxID=2569538 RepID=A0A4V5NVE9_9GAMM|nr:TetR/AcrR family transcriptional regulator [Ferrimonas sediminicola]TKB49394.1 TetR/AcrR family transcriptional regulator [Ferrimonas sediminicola]